MTHRHGPAQNPLPRLSAPSLSSRAGAKSNSAPQCAVIIVTGRCEIQPRASARGPPAGENRLSQSWSGTAGNRPPPSALLKCHRGGHPTKLTIDTDGRTLTCEGDGPIRAIPLFSPEAFEILSREWVRVGWSLAYYFTFTWCGQPILQLPEDLVRFQEVVASLRPDVIIETGINLGGSLLFHATLCEALGNGRVIGIDCTINSETRSALTSHRLSHRIAMVEGDSTAPATVTQVRNQVRPGESVLVVLDSDHTCAHVSRELEAYAPLVTPGSCIIATDGVMRDLVDVPGGRANWVEDNPATAARTFLASHPEFEMRPPVWRVNRGPLREAITYWPNGWLWRKA